MTAVYSFQFSKFTKRTYKYGSNRLFGEEILNITNLYLICVFHFNHRKHRVVAELIECTGYIIGYPIYTAALCSTGFH